MKRGNNLLEDLNLPDFLNDRLVDDIFGDSVRRRTKTNQYSVVSKTDDKITMYVNALGLSRDDIEIKVIEDRIVVISNKDLDDENPLVRNIGHSFTLPRDFDDETIEATFDNGILKITIEKLEDPTPPERVIEIN